MSKFKLNQRVRIDNVIVGNIVGLPTKQDNRYTISSPGISKANESRIKAFCIGNGSIKKDQTRND